MTERETHGADAARRLVVGNWKMHGSIAALGEIAAIAAGVDRGLRADTRAVVCPPSPLIAPARARTRGGALELGAQDCHAAATGAHTGDVSAEMLAEAGARWVIVGHSERRADHGESDADARAKCRAAARAGLTPILCVGEGAETRDAGRAEAVVSASLKASAPDAPPPSGVFAVAYEPVWAIGTGRTPSQAEIVEMTGALRATLTALYGRDAARARILYGGSVKPANAGEILSAEGVAGVLVGGASLKAADFLAIHAAALSAP